MVLHFSTGGGLKIWYCTSALTPIFTHYLVLLSSISFLVILSNNCPFCIDALCCKNFFVNLVIKLVVVVVVVVVVVDIADIWKRLTILNTQLSAYSSFVRAISLW